MFDGVDVRGSASAFAGAGDDEVQPVAPLVEEAREVPAAGGFPLVFAPRAPRAMLVQTDKFGTSVANSLRVYSDTLRTKRRQRAEEAAAKTGVKMVFPLVICIFPTIWVVTIGPAAITFVQVLFPIVNK